MKKTLWIMAVLLTGALLLAGCGGNITHNVDSKSYMAEEFKDAPAWVVDGGSSMEGGNAAVGSAKIGKAGMSFAKTEAMAMGRNELARQIQVKVNDLVKNFTQQIGMGDDQTVDKVAVQVSKQVTKQSLSGSRQKTAWISPSSTLYVLVTIDPDVLKNSVRESVQTSMRNEKAMWQQFQAKKGFKELDQEIEKQFGKFKSEQ